MPVASDIILDWIAEDGYSLSEDGWIRPQDRKFYFEVTAEKDGHRRIARRILNMIAWMPGPWELLILAVIPV